MRLPFESWTDTFFKLGFQKRKRKKKNRTHFRKLYFESLEPREMLAGDVGDTLADALEVVLTSDVEHVETQTVGDGTNLDSDVDVYEVALEAGDTLSADVDAEYLDDGSSLSTLDSHLRIFDSTGMELDSNDDAIDPDTGDSGYDAALTFTASSADTYYIGVSGYGNVYYDPAVSGSGEVGSTGDYALQIEVSDPAPEIALFLDDGYQELYDNASSVDFGTSLVGTAVSKLFVIENYGSGDLNVDFANLTLPNGFVLSDPSAVNVTVSPYSSAATRWNFPTRAATRSRSGRPRSALQSLKCSRSRISARRI